MSTAQSYKTPRTRCSKKPFYCDFCLNDQKNAIIFMLFEELPKHNCRPWSVGFCFTSGAVQLARVMDQITIKTPNPKCRLYLCLIEFIDWRYSLSFWYFRPLLWTSAPLTFSLVHLPPPPPVWISTEVSIYTVCNGGEGIGLCGEHLQQLYTVYLTRFRNYKIVLPP